jgi:hypothetical protein
MPRKADVRLGFRRQTSAFIGFAPPKKPMKDDK